MMQSRLLLVLLLWLFTCPFLSLCQQGEGKECRTDLPCDREAGLHCSPKPRGFCQECGVNNRQNNFDIRIVGGRPTDPNAWPWMAGIMKRTSKDFVICGGTLITDRHVLTAAHCFNDLAPDDLMVRLGEHDLSKDSDNSPMDFDIENLKIHENYDSKITDNDIALITLGMEVIFNEFIWPACLPTPNMKIVNEVGLVAGWGTKYLDGPTNSVLHEASVKVWPQTDCTQAYFDRTVTNNMLCCGWTTGKIDSCHGDSGGPFMMQIGFSKKWILIGIVSWGRGCASPNQPGVYVKVSNYLDWIEMHTKTVGTPSPPKGSFCSDGYESLIVAPEWCVKINTNKLNWNQSSEACVADGGTLAIVDSKEKQEAITKLLNDKTVKEAWIGMHRDINGNFKWIDGSPLKYESWVTGQPDNYQGSEECVTLDKFYRYLWNDDGCSKPMFHICEKKKQNSCPVGWITNAKTKTCFHIGKEKLNYESSVTYCAGKGGSLAVITNEEDMTFARNHLNENIIKEAWIGLRRDRKGDFKWIDGSPLQYQNWVTNQPDNYQGSEECVTLDKFFEYLWNDDGCNKPMQQLCSRKPTGKL